MRWDITSGLFSIRQGWVSWKIGRHGGRVEVLTKWYEGFFVLGDVDIIVSAC